MINSKMTIPFLKNLFLILAVFWMLTGVGMMFAVSEGGWYPTIAIVMNIMSVLGVCVANTYSELQSKGVFKHASKG